MKGFIAGFLSLIMLVVLLAVGIGADWFDTWLGNRVEYIDRKIDDATNYETLKKVEDTCRAMQASYEADRLTYEQYKDSDNEEKQSWAEQAKMRANKTAATYNSYILENSFVWKDAVPDDIRIELPILN